MYSDDPRYLPSYVGNRTLPLCPYVIHETVRSILYLTWTMLFLVNFFEELFLLWEMRHILFFCVVVIIIPACRCPLLNIGLPNWFSGWLVRCHLHPSTPCSLDEVVGPYARRPSHAVLSHTWSPLQNLFPPSAVRSSRYLACPLPLQLANPLGYVDYICSSTNFLVSDSTT